MMADQANHTRRRAPEAAASAGALRAIPARGGFGAISVSAFVFVLIAFLGLAGFAGSAASEVTEISDAEDGARRVREDLIVFLEGDAADSEASVRVPALSSFNFDRERYPGALRTELSSRTEAPYRGRVAVTVSLFAGNRLIKRSIVSPYVQIGEDVVVASRDLRRGDVLKGGDLEVVERDQARLRSGYFGVTEDLVGTRMRRSIRRGNVIFSAAVEEVPVVERGDRVVVVLESGALRLQSVGRAQEAGGVGEWIRVLNLESKKELSGRLDRSGRVHVAF
ncbi:MAG: flagellar basal body P-ring formation chaperone FlgA [Myxococcota bacterium]